MIATIGAPQAFGRFGFQPLGSAPGFTLSNEGFRVRESSGDFLAFRSPILEPKVQAINDRRFIVTAKSQRFSPNALSVNLLSPGFELTFPDDFELKVSALSSPILSWPGGSVNAGNPTAESRWILLSFQDPQPPLLLVFDKPIQMQIFGRSGDWQLQTTQPYRGKVRVCLPIGQRRIGAQVSQIGEAVQQVLAWETQLTAPAPNLVRQEVRQEGNHLIATWTFDRPHAVVPVSLLWARLGGYPLELRTGVRESGATLVEGPIAYATESRLIVRFPLLPLFPGRPLALGENSFAHLANASAFDLPSVVELALSNFSPHRDSLTVRSTESTLNEFRLNRTSQKELWTQMEVLYGASGEGVDLLAAHALLWQSALTTDGKASRDNAFLSQVLRWRDAFTWRLMIPDHTTRRRATALAALACVFSPELERKLTGCLLEASLAADRIWVDYQARRKLGTPASKLVNPLDRLRYGVFRPQQGSQFDRFVESLTSGLRVIAPFPVLVRPNGSKVLLEWSVEENDEELTLICAWPVQVEPKENIAQITPVAGLGAVAIRLTPKGSGKCSLSLHIPEDARALPTLAAAPPYRE